MHLFCFGLGYVAEATARLLLDKGWRVSGTCRNEEKFHRLRALGVTAHLFDDGAPLLFPEDALIGVTHILHSIPPGPGGDVVYGEHSDDLKNYANVQWTGYLSTTGVYGDYNGETVQEDSPLRATEPRALRRIEAERLWREDSAMSAHVFRLSGIYGPERNALERVKSGTAKRVIKKGQVFSRIHRDDAAQTLLKSIENPCPGEIYNVADDMPAASHETLEYAATLLNMPNPPAVSADDPSLSAMAREFYRSCRRVDNAKIRNALGVKLQYPDYKAGLNAIFKAEIAA